MTQKALKQMYQLLLTEPHAPTVCAQLERIAREALAEHAMRETQRLGQEIEQEPVAHSVIAGALFDFMGWLTSRKERLVLSSADEASPAVDAIRDFAKMRGLSLDDAKVQDWDTAPPQRTWVGLMDEEVIAASASATYMDDLDAWTFAKAIEQALKEKNT